MPRTPPKEWFYYVVAELEKNPDVKNPKRLAGWLWTHFMKPETKKAILKAEGKFDPLKKRSKLINMPKVVAFDDIEGRGLIRVLRRDDGSHFPEFAVYPSKVMQTVGFHMEESLRDARFSLEAKGKWVLRTNKFSIFVYV